MKHIAQLTLGFLALAVLVMISGCASAEKPDYQGKKGTTPTVHDYYPSKGKK